MSKISAYGLAMGVKQRRFPYEACLRSLDSFCDEIVVAYDKRFDDPDTFTQLSSKIKLLEIEYQFDTWDFMNIALTQARRACDGEWCYIYGMDEVFHAHQTANLRNAVENAQPDWNAITVRILCGVFFDYISVGYFMVEQHRIGLTRNRPELRHGTAPIQTGQNDAKDWDGKFIKFGYDDFSFFDESIGTNYWGDKERHWVDDSYDIPESISGDSVEAVLYRLEHYTHIWHYAWYHIGRKAEQMKQTKIYLDRVYGRSKELDIDKLIADLNATIILDPTTTGVLFNGKIITDGLSHIELKHPSCVQDWLQEMTLDAV